MHMQLLGDDERRALPEHSFLGNEEQVWHYTNAAGAHGILEHQCFWATDATMLNDSSEIQFGIGALELAYESWKPPEDASAEVLDALGEAVAGIEDELAARSPFILSGSKTPRLLNQWMHYAHDAGFALELRAEPLTIPLDDEDDGTEWEESSILPPAWLNVIYGRDAAVVHAQRVLDGISAPDGVVSRAFEIGFKPQMFLGDNLVMLVATLKDDGFAAEQEARFVVAQPPMRYVRFRPSARGILPYVELVSPPDVDGPPTLAATQSSRGELPVQRVYVGPPQATAARRVRSTERYRLARGLKVSVRDSGIPYLP